MEQRISKYYKIKTDLLTKSKELNANKISIETLQNNYGSTCDLSLIQEAYNKQEKEISLLKETFDTLTKDMHNEILSLKQKMQNMFDTYKDLQKALMDSNSTEEKDEFEVNMAKYLYGNCNDNHQIRSDPPIQGVYKWKSGSGSEIIGFELESKKEEHNINIELERKD